MAGNDEKRNKNYMFERMSSEDLRELLRLDIHADSSEELDPGYILKIMEVLEERENKDTFDKYPDVDNAFQSFKENYLPHIDSAESLYDWDIEEEDIKSHSLSEHYPSKRRNKPHRFVKLKRLSLVAAVFIVIFTLFFSSTALGDSVWQSIAQWGRTTFGFSDRVATTEINEELRSLHEVLAEHGITELVVPTWIPDGFELIDLDVFELPEYIVFSALFEDIERILVIQINALKNQIGTAYERNDEEIYVLPQNGIDHYIMSNMDFVTVVWSNKNYECSFSGDISKGDAMLMINSIYER